MILIVHLKIKHLIQTCLIKIHYIENVTNLKVINDTEYCKTFVKYFNIIT